MSKHRETAAERLWKEKLDLRGSWGETVVLIIFAAAIGSITLMTTFL
ncbi:MAG: hypothetical protein ACRED5_06135 [Propylenella sp.]